jgi:hypothetical protein
MSDALTNNKKFNLYLDETNNMLFRSMAIEKKYLKPDNESGIKMLAEQQKFSLLRALKLFFT